MSLDPITMLLMMGAYESPDKTASIKTESRPRRRRSGGIPAPNFKSFEEFRLACGLPATRRPWGTMPKGWNE